MQAAVPSGPHCAFEVVSGKVYLVPCHRQPQQTQMQQFVIPAVECQQGTLLKLMGRAARAHGGHQDAEQCHTEQMPYLDGTRWREVKAVHVLGCCRLLASPLGPTAFPLVATCLVIAPCTTAVVLMA